MKGSVKKDTKTGKYFYIVDIGIDSLTGKRKQKKRSLLPKKKQKMREQCYSQKFIMEYM